MKKYRLYMGQNALLCLCLGFDKNANSIGINTAMLVILISLATIGVCVFCAVTSVAALFYSIDRKDKKEMKKTIAIILVCCLCAALCSCGKSKEVQKADELILAIGEVSLDSEEAILNALDCYNALTEKEKNSVENYRILEQAQVSYLEMLLLSIENIRLEDKETLSKARKYYESLTTNQKEMTDCLAKLELLESEHVQLEAFEELKELIRTKGTPVKEGGVNNSDTIVKWTCGGLELSSGGSLSFMVNVDIDNADDITIGRTMYYPETWINISIYKDEFDVYFHSMYNAFASSADLDLAEGKMENIKYKTYSVNGELPDITDYSSSTFNMVRCDAPFNSDREYGEYIRQCIHERICTILQIYKNNLEFDITKLGFSSDVASNIG